MTKNLSQDPVIRAFYCRVDRLCFPDVKGAMAHLKMGHDVKHFDPILIGERAWE